MSKGIRHVGPVQLMIAAFVISAVLRTGAQGVALANSDPTTTPVSVPEQICQPAPDIAGLLQKIRLRQAQLDEEARRISERRLTLDKVEARVAAEMASLGAAQDRLEATLAIADGAAENDLLRLTQVYENMKSKNAASIFESMDINFASGFLSRMNPKAAAGILSELPADKAYSISVVMAGRNARAPTK